MSRAWTLQEGVLARDCLLQFDDCVLNTNWMDFRGYLFPQDVLSPSGSCSWVTINWWWMDRKINRGCYEKVRLFVAYILSFAVLPFTYFIIKLNGRSKPGDLITYGEGEQLLVPADMDTLLADELCHSIRESLRPPIAKTKWSSTSTHVENSTVRLRNVWNALVGRSTSEPQDMHLILANLLGFNAGFMLHLATRPGDRMKASTLSLRVYRLLLAALDIFKDHFPAIRQI